jgi:hypothetical protein
MSSVWIIVLDISGSMGEGFSARPVADPLAERGAWKTKLDAAKDLLLRQIAASRVQDTAVLTFSDTARKIFHGARTSFSQAENAVRSLGAGGNTNLAAGLAAVVDDPAFEGYRALSVLILSDGLSNRGDPVAAAERLVAKYPYARIDTILIDDTEAGRLVAEAVSINGWVRPAVSSDLLEKAVPLGKAASLQHEIAGLGRQRLALETELAAAVAAPVPTLLTITSPLRLTTYSLREEIAPLMEAVEALQKTADDAAGVTYRGSVTSLSQSSPVTISLSGLREAVQLVLELVIPWRREHARAMLRLKEQEAELENKRRQAQLDRENAEVDRLCMENRRLVIQLDRERLDLATEALRRLDPHGELSEELRGVHLYRILRGLETLTESSVEFQASGPGFEERPNPRKLT